MSYDSGSNYKYPPQGSAISTEKYEVVADWPGRFIMIGAKMELLDTIGNRVRIRVTHPDQNEMIMWDLRDKNHPKYMPHLFKRLQP